MAISGLHKTSQKGFENSLADRWREEWLGELLSALKKERYAAAALLAFDWYTEENGLDRNEKWAGGERIDLRGLSFRELSLPGVDFSGARLDHSEFVDVNLRGAKLRFTCFSASVFVHPDLTKADLSKADFSGAEFYGADLTEADCASADFSKATLARQINASGANFRGASFCSATIQSLVWNAKTKFLGANLTGCAFTNDPILKRHIEDQNWLAAKERQLKQTRTGRIVWLLWGMTSNYGQSFCRWLSVSFAIAVLYGIAYQYLPLQMSLGNVDPILARFYFSIVTFTTLGFGDVLPASNLAVVVVMSEVICGYLMLGALISILADKFARRS